LVVSDAYHHEMHCLIRHTYFRRIHVGTVQITPLLPI
jgi:hypothetical protein